MKLNPMPQVNVRTLYNGGKMQSVITYWNPPAVENALWAWATVQRVAKRLHWKPPESLVKLVDQAAAEPDLKKQDDSVAAVPGGDGRRGQPDRAVPADLPDRRAQDIKEFPLTAAGWQARPARREAGDS